MFDVVAVFEDGGANCADNALVLSQERKATSVASSEVMVVATSKKIRSAVLDGVNNRRSCACG